MLALVLVLAGAVALSSCGAGAKTAAAEITGGDPARGKAAIERYGCGACHTIPGVREARGLVGPLLEGVATRAYIGGVLPNTPENLMRWVRNPRDVNHQTVMPNLGVTEHDSRDIAGYLYTLR